MGLTALKLNTTYIKEQNLAKYALGENVIKRNLHVILGFRQK